MNCTKSAYKTPSFLFVLLPEQHCVSENKQKDPTHEKVLEKCLLRDSIVLSAQVFNGQRIGACALRVENLQNRTPGQSKASLSSLSHSRWAMPVLRAPRVECLGSLHFSQSFHIDFVEFAFPPVTYISKGALPLTHRI